MVCGFKKCNEEYQTLADPTLNITEMLPESSLKFHKVFQRHNLVTAYITN